MRGNSPDVVAEERSKSFKVTFLDYCSMIITFLRKIWIKVYLPSLKPKQAQEQCKPLSNHLRLDKRLPSP